MRHLPFIHYSLSFLQIQTGAVSFLLPASSFLDELFLLQQSLQQHFPFVQKRDRYACKAQMGSIITNCSLLGCVPSFSADPMCPYKVCAFPIPTSLIPDFFFLVGLKLGWKFDWMEGQRKKHI